MVVTHLHYSTHVSSPLSDVWKWITSVKGISDEMWPYFKMTAPKHVVSLNDIELILGKPMFRSRIYLFGFLPFGYDDMTLIEFEDGKGFTEEFPMTSMKLWCYQRHITEETDGIHITDDLTFEPEHAAGVISRFMKKVFRSSASSN